MGARRAGESLWLQPIGRCPGHESRETVDHLLCCGTWLEYGLAERYDRLLSRPGENPKAKIEPIGHDKLPLLPGGGTHSLNA